MVLERKRKRERREREGGGERASIKLFKNRVTQLFTYKNRDIDTCKLHLLSCAVLNLH